MTFSLSGRRGVVLGVANELSIATSICRNLVNSGAKIVASYFPDKPGLAKNLGRAEKAVGGIVDLVPLDLLSEESITGFYQEAGRLLGGEIDFIVHSVAFSDEITKPVHLVSRGGFDTAMASSAYSFLAAVRGAHPLLRDNASIVALSYLGAERVMPGYNIMGVAKAALESAVRYTAWELGDRGIRVNAVSAGPIKTLAATAIGGFSKISGVYEKTSPMRRNVTQDEVAKSVLFLLSDGSVMISGETLHVDGGFHAMGVGSGD